MAFVAFDLATVKNNARYLLRDTNPLSYRYTDVEIQEWIWEGQQEIIRRNSAAADEGANMSYKIPLVSVSYTAALSNYVAGRALMDDAEAGSMARAEVLMRSFDAETQVF